MSANWWDNDPVVEPPAAPARDAPPGRDAQSSAYLAQTDTLLGLTPGTSERQIAQESGFDDNALSRSGARGAAQVMPQTLAALSARAGRDLDPNDRADALLMHRELMRENMARFGNQADALRAYNSGWDRSKWDNRETNDYVARIGNGKDTPAAAPHWWDNDPVVDAAAPRPAAPADQPDKTRTWGEAAGDAALSVAKGVVDSGQAAVGLADLATGNLAGRGLQAIGYDPQRTNAMLSGMQSERQRQIDARVNAADGFVDTVKAYARDPSGIVSAGLESAPGMIGMAGVGRAVAERAFLKGGAAAVDAAASRIAWASSAAEGAQTAGQQQEQAREAGRTYLQSAPTSLAAGAGTALIGRVANMVPGMHDANVALATAGLTPSKARTIMAAGKALAKTMFAEGVLEELPQSAQEQVWQNLGMGEPWDKGVGQQAAQGMIVGAAMGAGAGSVEALSHARATYDAAKEKGFHVDPPLTTDAPDVQRKKTVAIFNGLAAQVGMSAGAVKAAVEASAGKPLADLGAFFQRITDAYASRGLTGAAVEPHVAATLTAGPVAPPPQEGDKAVWRNKDTDVPVTMGNGPAQKGPDGRMYQPVIGPDGMPSFVPADEIKPADETKAPKRETPPAKTETPPPAEPDYTGLSETAAPVDRAAHSAATSPLNDLPEPTPGQRDAGNYPMGHQRIAGLNVTLQVPEGGTRVSKADAEEAWTSQVVKAHYGHVLGTKGMDGMPVDTFVKPGTPDDFDGTAFVVDQVNPTTNAPDEHKVMLGYGSMSEAKAAYQANYPAGWKGLGAISAVPMPELKTWLAGDTSKPFHQPAAAPVQAPTPAPTPSAAPITAPAAGAGPAQRLVAQVGSTPKQATPLTLRTNADGTHTPWLDGHEVLDFDSAKPVVIPAGASNRQVLDAIRQAGSFGKSAKVFKVEPDAPASNALPQEVKDALTGQVDRGLVDDLDDQPAPTEPHAAWWHAASREQRAPLVEAAGLPALAATTTDWTVFSAAAQAKIIAAREAADASTTPGTDVVQTPAPTRDEIHALADRKGIAWDNDPAFMAMTKAVTGQEHLDDLTQAQRVALAEHLTALPDKTAAPKVNPIAAAKAKAEAAAAAAADKVAKAAQAQRSATREKERSVYRELVARAALVGKSLDEVTAAVKARLGQAGEGMKVPLLARAIHKQLAKNAAELLKQQYRHPDIRAAAVAEAVTQAFPDAEVPEVERHGALIAGFDHALAGKTKSTLAGEHLADRLTGYEAAQRWMQTEQGAAWYEGRPVNKLANTGIDLRRWYEQMKAAMKAGESDTTKAWAQIERATARADLFAPLLPEGVTPGFQLYVEHLRAHTATFKEYLDTLDMRGAAYYRSRYSKNVPNHELLLNGERVPNSLSEEDRQRFRDDAAYRIKWMQDAADDYVRRVREFIGFAQGKSSVKEAAQAFSDLYIASSAPDSYVKLTPAGRALRNGEPHLFSGRDAHLTQLRVDSTWTEHLIDKETTIELPDKTTPLVPPRLDRVTRDGASVRGDKSVTPAQFKTRFGVADVGFGQWVAGKQDQDHLNYAYDALVDLATHFGLPTTQGIGFGGQLHFTIGALGHGKYAAHFATGQPSPIGNVEVINLTNTKGDGTVYHEWVHALDHYLGGEWMGPRGVRSQVLRYLTRGVSTPASIERYAKSFLFGGTYWSNDKRMDKQEAAREGMRRGLNNKSAYKSNADKLGKDYWGNEKELLARAGEAWAADTLGHTNTYLVNPEWVGDGKVTKDKGYRGTPYPSGDERVAFNLIYTALAKSVTWTNGRPSVSLAAFQANLPDAITAGEARRIELQDETAMRAFHDEEVAKRADAAAEQASEAADQARREQAEMDALADAKLKALEPPAPPPAPPIVDGPSVADTSGPLTEQDLSDLWDEAAAELREQAANEPDTAPPGEAPASRWSQTGLEELLERASDADLIATSADGVPNVPTIQELGAMGVTRHLGDGYFETTGTDAEGRAWSMTWDGGGSMHRTTDGSAWTNVSLHGHTPYPSGVKRAVQKAIDQIASDRRAQWAQEPRVDPLTGDKPAADPTAAALLGKAALLGVKGADDALKALSALFGKPGSRLMSFPGGIDEQTYQQAKVHMRDALANFQAAGKTLKDLFKMLVEAFGDGFKPYAMRFAQEQSLSAQLGSAPTAAMQIAAKVQARLSMGHSFDWRVLFGWADEAHGGTQAEGKYTPKDAYDAMEAGVNRYLLAHPDIYSPAVGREDALRAVAALERITALLPTQTKRTAEQDQFQQYSTVPALAFVANWVANIHAGETMGEFSAGIGGLAVFAKNAGARLVLNELSSRRAALLQEVFPDARVFHENAEQIHNILSADIQPTVVVINPPFSSSAATGVKATTVGAQHVEQALARLEPAGRLVAIVGKGMAMDAPAFAAWWKKIGAKYSVRAAIPMDGAGYAKYGTTYDNVLLVIDKVPPHGAAPITTAAKTYTELVGLLAEVRDERPATHVPVNDRDSAQPDPDRGGHDAPVGDGKGAPAAPPAGPGVPGGVGPGTPAQRPGLGTGGGSGVGPGRSPRPGGPASRPGGLTAAGGTDTQRGGAPGAATGGGPDSGGHTTGLTISSEQVSSAELTDSVFESYTPQRLQVPGAKAHPGALVESAAMASVLPPAVTYTPNLPRSTIEGGLLSIAQIEAVVYAGQAHSQVLELRSDRATLHAMGLDNKGVADDIPYRRGFFIGDGTGVGKGREISGILLDNMRQGRDKHVWISEKQPLINDAARDFAGVQEGVTADSVLTGNRIFNLSKKTEPETWRVTADDGILYTTYSTLRSAQKFGNFDKGDEVALKDGRTGTLVTISKNKRTAKVRLGDASKATTVAFDDIDTIDNDGSFERSLNARPPAGWVPRTRLDQIVEWLGADFDGVIAFDEAHNAGNAIPIRGERGKGPVSAQATAVVALQNRLPNARIVYVSATGATEVSNLAFATRLGLWGPGTPFPSVHNFIAEMTAGGLATMELVARDLKQAGSYMARSLSFDGVTYGRAEHELSPNQHEVYNRLADAWQVTLQNFMAALQATGVVNANGTTRNSRALANAKGAYWGAQQRFFNQIITSMQMPTVIEGIERDLAAGQAVVLQLVNTNEAQQERSLAAQAAEGESNDLEDLDLTPRDQLLQMVQKAFPVQQYHDVMDAQTGRMVSVPVTDSQGQPVLNAEAVAMRDRLLQDLRDIKVPDGPLEIILNTFGPQVVAEVTGRKQRVVRKADADGNVKSQIEKRGDAAVRADADAFMADKKRILVFSDAGGTGFSFHADLTQANQRKRSHYLIQPGWRANKAVQGLGRTHRTNQASAPHYTLASTNIPAHKRFLSSIARRLDQLGALTKGQRDTSSGGLFSEKDNLESVYATRAARRLIDDIRLGQVEGLAFDDFLRQMGLEDIVNPTTNQIAEADYPPTRQFLNRMLSLKLETQELVFNAFIARMEEAVELAAQRGELDTGMQTIRALSTEIEREETVHVDARTGAETKYVQLALNQATRMYSFPDETAQGGKIDWVVNAKSGRVWGKVRSGNMTKKDGSVVDRYRMLGTGGYQVMDATDFSGPKAGAYTAIDEGKAHELWAAESAARPPTYREEAHMIVGAMLPIWDRLKTDGRLQVVRTQTTDGQRLLGRLIHPTQVADLLRRLDLASAESRLSPEAVFARLLKGEVAELANRWSLKRARVSDDVRVEIVTPSGLYGAAVAELVNLGVIAEKIQWQERYFVPNAEVLAKLLKNKPVVSLTNPNAAQDDAPAAAPPAAPTVSPEAAGEARAQAAGLPVIEHTVQKTGKLIRGVVTRHLTEAQAKTINDFVWKKDGGIFFRLSDLARVLDKYPLPPAAGGTLQDIGRTSARIAQQGYARADVPRVQAANALQKLIEEHAAGKISDGAFHLRVKVLADRMSAVSDTKAANKLMGERARGVDIVREKLLAARRRGELDHETVEFALWALGKNPALAEHLGISIRSPQSDRAAGDYNPAAEIIRLFKGGASIDTIVHEILHHAERMMPPAMQAAIRREWASQLATAIKNGTPEQVEALKNVPLAMAGDQAAYQALTKAIQEGPLNYAEHYPLVNPSEYWAVNGARILGEQRSAAEDSIWHKVRQFLRELVQKARALVGLSSTAPIIRALHYVTDASHFHAERGGRFVSPRMLSDPKAVLQQIRQYTPEQAEALALAGINTRSTLQRAGDKVRAYYDGAIAAWSDNWARQFQQGYIDQFTGIALADKSLFGVMLPDQSNYVAARLANGGTSSVMRALLLHGQAQWAANGQHLEKIPGTQGLLDIFTPLGDHLDAFFGWMVGNRAARLMKEGRENNLSKDQIAVLQALNVGHEAAFAKAALQFAAFKRSVLDLAEQAGLIKGDARAVWDQSDYIPFYREVDAKALFSATGKFTRGPVQKKGLAGQSSGIRTLKGGSQALNDPMENILMNFSRLIDASLKNNAISKTVHSYAVAKSGLVTKVGYTMNAQIVPAAQVRQMLADAGTPQSVLDTMPPAVFEGMAKMWAIQAPTDPDVVRVMVDGKPEFWRVTDPLLLKALTSFVPFDFPGLGVMRAFKRVLTAGVTATPDFMARNFVRDSVSVALVGRDTFHPIDSLKGMVKAYNESGEAEAMMFAGAAFQSGNTNANDPTGTATAMRRALRVKGLKAGSVSHSLATVLDTPAKFWDKYKHFGEAIENANREAIYAATTRAGRGVTAAAFESKDVMDFSLRGSSPVYQLLADVLPFFNARVQGVYRVGRADPARLAKYGALMMVISVMLALANSGNDDYDQLSDWEKDNYWHFWLGGEHFKLPKAFEVGAVFGTLPERLVRYIKGQDSASKAGTRIWNALYEQMAFDPVPQAVRPALNAWANKNTFQERPIESMRDLDKLPSERFNATTSPTARGVVQSMASAADAINLGPKKLEYLVQGYLGTVGLYALGLSDMAVDAMNGAPPQPTRRLDELPVLKSFYAQEPTKYTRFESDLYALRREVDLIYRSVQALERDDSDDAAEALARKHEAKLDVRDQVDAAAVSLNDLNKDRDEVLRDPKLTPAEKRTLIDAIYKDRAEQAREAMQDPDVMATQ